jgi:uncharacterized protein (DUF1015 family)
MRYSLALDDIGDVICPPYDAMDLPTIEAMLRSHPRNIVRLILPRLVREPLGAEDPYLTAAELLARWRRQQTLTTDAAKGIYVYEYGSGTDLVRGLVGALDLDRRNRHMILPHENVVPEIVADRLVMVEAAQAQLEPILLVYDGDGATSGPIDAARSREPLTDVTARDGSVHRLWAITDPEDLAVIKQGIRAHQALIADGHHRYATYREMRRRYRARGERSGPWDRGLALLIDQSQCPLRLSAIHRSITDLDLLALAPPPGYVATAATPVTGGPPQAPERVGDIVVTDGARQRTFTLAGTQHDARIDVERLHGDLLPAWSVSEARLGFHHSVSQAITHAAQEGGVAVLLHPVTLAEVMSTARAGRSMPLKTTSFGPKPHIGLVMRSFADDP